jgi:tetratricopeptide (TPR) repeat protein
VWAWKRRRAEGIALFTAFLVAGPLFQLYTNTAYPDALTKGIIARFYILPSIPVAIVAGLGAWWLLEHAAALRVVRPAVAVGIASALVLAIPVAAAADHYSANDQSGNKVAETFAHDLLGPLPPDTLLLTRGDSNLDTVVYVQKVQHFRPDVIALDTELLKLPNYVTQALQEHPGLLIPFTQFDGGVHTSLNTLMSDNMSKRPIYDAGKQAEKDFGKGFDQQLEGLSIQYVPKGTAPDKSALEAKDPQKWASALHFPRTYPASTWEGGDIANKYSEAAYEIATAIQLSSNTANVPLAEKLYRTAIRLDPNFPQPYKNLGLILRTNGGDPKEIVKVWQTYLKLNPKDPQDSDIREAIAQYQSKK